MNWGEYGEDAEGVVLRRLERPMVAFSVGDGTKIES